MVVSPLATNTHHHYHEGFNKSATPLVCNIQNQLREEAKQSTTHLGQPFIHASMKLQKTTNFFDIMDGSLVTFGGYANNIHIDRSDHFPSEESKKIKHLIKSQVDTRFGSYVDVFEKLFGEETNVPIETTCCWCLMESCDEY